MFGLGILYIVLFWWAPDACPCMIGALKECFSDIFCSPYPVPRVTTAVSAHTLTLSSVLAPDTPEYTPMENTADRL